MKEVKCMYHVYINVCISMLPFSKKKKKCVYLICLSKPFKKMQSGIDKLLFYMDSL